MSAASSMQLSLFVRQVKAMLDAGVPIVRALEFYSQGDSSEFGRVVEECTDQVRMGKYMSKAFSAHPKYFSRVFLGLLNAGEETGALTRMMDRLADLLEGQMRLSRMLSAALTYPIFLVSVAVTIGLLFIFAILPPIEQVFETIHVPLPLPTQMLLFMGHFVRNPIVIGAALALAVEMFVHGPLLWKKLRSQRARRHRVDSIPFLVPVLGPAYRKVLAARVMYTLATALEVGLTLSHALDLCRGTLNNERAAGAIRMISKEIADGTSLANAICMTDFFPTATVPLVAMGEEAGNLATALSYVARINEEAADYAIQACISLLEPLFMCFLGIVSTFLVLACMLPLVTLLKSL